MKDEIHRARIVFKIEECRAKLRGADELVDCLTPEQAYLCNCSLSFGRGCFCKHPDREQIIHRSKNADEKLDSRSDY